MNATGSHESSADEEFREHASGIQDAVVRISETIRLRSGDLTPHQAAQFREWWSSQHGPAMLQAAAALEELARILHTVGADESANNEPDQDSQSA